MSSATGRGIRVAIIDSGVHAAHPHVAGVAGGVGVGRDGSIFSDYVDTLGHGTAVTAAIKEKAPDADVYAVRIFERHLSASMTALVRAIDWAADAGVHLINLSLGTTNMNHEAALRGAVQRALASGALVVAARDDEGVRWLPGSLAGVIAVQLDWDCPRDEYRTVLVDGTEVFRASGYPRTIPGVPPQRNLNGISFAVANVTGLLARSGSTQLSMWLAARKASLAGR